jgi:spermidine/putrescine transport system substrate-binding protein
MRLFAALLCLIALTGPGRAMAQSKELLLFNWSNYMPPALLKRFEAETGIKVTLDTYDTNDALLAKLQAGGGGYDVVVPTGPTLQAMIRDGLVQKIDVSALSNFHNLRAPFDHPVYDPDRAYSAPYMWGTTGIAYDKTALGLTLDDSWKEIFEPRPQVAGKIAMLAEMGEVYSAAAYYLGFDTCTTDPAQAQKILETLQQQKPSVKLYSSSGSIDRIASGEVVMHHMYNGAAHRAALRKPGITYIYPKEGLTLWGDNFAVPKGAPHVDAAKIFINFMMDPKNAAEASNYTGYNNAVAGSDAMLLPALRDDPAVNPPAQMITRLRAAKECPKAAIDLREKVWTRLQR